MITATQDVYLDSYLAPLAPYLQRDDVTDIYVNRPCEIWVEALDGTITRHDAPGLTTPVLERLARQIAATNAQGVSREHPLLAANLPDGSRVQIVLPPATRGTIAMAVRKQALHALSLDEMADAGSFDQVRLSQAGEIGGDPEARPLAEEDVRSTLRNAVRARRTILVSGGSSTGKTTFLNALIQEIPVRERLIVIEDTPEVRLGHPNAVGLVAARGSMGEADVTADDLLIASLRMRPDRIILGEVRGFEAITFLRAANSGHPGSLCTIHADTPERAIEQLALLVLQAGPGMSWNDIIQYVRRSIAFVVQLERIGGMRIVSNVMKV